ncbi:putative NLR family CARD domain-containing protein 4 [Apostichopus japonicus]|uniref:Putative NLR family CARD domain-containing protein 4 n=1 Tax=Stichopus japonicus TaxID=307972 RepID=A0A2G8LHF4_STIJA|nr:putative NLR family CARD domain-containing protein 4 [Apostichopus japonicus]
MGNKTSRKKGGKTKSQSTKKPTLTSQTSHQDSVTSAAQPAKTEEEFQASRRTPSLSASNEDPSEEESVIVEDTAEPQTLEESGVNASIEGAESYDKAIQWERLQSYKNIFTDPRMRSNRRIIEGEPGYGKSTLTLQLAYDWCNGVPDSPLYDVEILILLKLRQMGNVTSIYKAIKLYLIPDERRIKTRDIREIIESCRSVAFQLDGYDEYPEKDKENDVGRIMMLQMFPESDVTLTTRYLPKEYDKSNTNRIKLTGFDDAARNEYIRKAVCGNNEQAVAKVKKGLKENVILDDLCQVPLFFSMFSHMTHEREDFQKFKSVTDFFRYMMRCFHHHTRNKAEEYNVERYATMFEANHEELSKVAFEGLSKENQQIVWEKVSLIKRLDGPDTPGKNIKTKTEVSFYHKIFCEWFASFHVTGIAAGVKDPAELEPSLGKMDPFDLQYVFRFACGLNSGAGSSIIEYLKSKKGGDKFAILCILEQSGKFDGITETVKELCSKRLTIGRDDTKLLQRSTIQLLQIASSHDVSIKHIRYVVATSLFVHVFIHSIRTMYCD